jgi:hypothetical protein
MGKVTSKQVERLRLFDQATARQRARETKRPAEPPARDRGWTREELYRRGRPDCRPE